MSGGISFSDDIGWVKAGWVYRTVLNNVCKSLKSSDHLSELYKELSDQEGDARIIEHIFAYRWDSVKMIQFCQAIKEGYSIAEKEGPEGWNDPEAFPSFLIAFLELVEISNHVQKLHS